MNNSLSQLTQLFTEQNKTPLPDTISPNDYPEEESRLPSWLQTTQTYLKTHSALVASLLLAALSIVFFLTITQSSILTSLSFFRIRWFALATIAIAAAATYYGSFWNIHIKDTIGSITAYTHSFLLTIISYLYLIRLNSEGIAFFRYELNTSIVFIPLAILIFVSNYTVFTRRKHIQLLTVAQVLFVLLFSYAIIGFIDVDNTFARNFNQGWLAVIFNWPAWIWLLFGSLALSFISSHNIPHPNTEKRLLYLAGYYIMNLQILLVMYILNFTYWYQTLLALISWNFIYTNVLSLMTKKNDLKYKPRLAISIMYHALLFLIVLYVG
jgi:hypothetical protein